MQSLIPPLLRTLEHVESELTTNGIGIETPNKYAVVGFGNYQNSARIITVAGQPILRLADVSHALSQIGQDGLWPDGYHAVAHALRNLPLKKKPNSNCVVHLLLATHEPRTVVDEETKSSLEELMCEKEVVIFNSLLNFYLQLGSKRQVGYGIDSEGRPRLISGKQEPSMNLVLKEQETILLRPASYSTCTSFIDYGEISLNHGGSVLDIYFAAKRETYDSFLTAFINSTMTTLSRHRHCEHCICKLNKRGLPVKKCKVYGIPSICNCLQNGHSVSKRLK